MTRATGEITITLNRGSFGTTDTAYIYVFDSANAYNSTGLEITFGDSEEPPAAAVSTITGMTSCDGCSTQ